MRINRLHFLVKSGTHDIFDTTAMQTPSQTNKKHKLLIIIADISSELFTWNVFKIPSWRSYETMTLTLQAYSINLSTVKK